MVMAVCRLQDGNAGLVKLVVEAQTRRRIQRLTATYMTLPLAGIAQQVGLAGAPAAELEVLR